MIMNSQASNQNIVVFNGDIEPPPFYWENDRAILTNQLNTPKASSISPLAKLMMSSKNFMQETEGFNSTG